MSIHDISSDTENEVLPAEALALHKEVKCPTRPKRRLKKPYKITINVANTQYNIIREVAQGLCNYRLSISCNKDWDLMWIDTKVTAEMLSKMKPYQKINHFPSMECLSKKNNLGKNLMKMKSYFPEEYNFFPATWMLPTEYSKFKTQCSQSNSKGYIVKPEALSRGKGIFLIKSYEELDYCAHCIVQEYVKDPYLIDGLKFDLRIYVMVYGCDPLRIFVYKEGLARFATEVYEEPSKSNMNNKFVHLTNYSINKNNENFVFSNDSENASTGHKRSLSFIWDYIDNHGGDSSILIKEIHQLIVKSICAVQPQLGHPYRTYQPNDIENNMCFEVLGFDILLDSKLKPWLLEVNHSPSFNTDTPFDHKVKEELIFDTLKVLHFDLNNRVKYQKEKEKELKTKAIDKFYRKLTKEQMNELRKRAMEKRDEYELVHSGGYTRIYPDLNLDKKYQKFLAAAEDFWDEFYGYKRWREIKNGSRKFTKPILPAKNTRKSNKVEIVKEENKFTTIKDWFPNNNDKKFVEPYKDRKEIEIVNIDEELKRLRNNTKELYNEKICDTVKRIYDSNKLHS